MSAYAMQIWNLVEISCFQLQLPRVLPPQPQPQPITNLLGIWSTLHKFATIVLNTLTNYARNKSGENW